MKLIFNILTWNFQNNLQFIQVSKIKHTEVIWAVVAINYWVYALIYLRTCKREKFHHISYTNFMFEVININFWQIWHLDVKSTSFWQKFLEDSICEWPPNYNTHFYFKKLLNELCWKVFIICEGFQKSKQIL